MDGAIRTGYNNLQVKIYAGLSTTLRMDPDNDLDRATIGQVSTFFPGGVFGEMDLYIPRDVNKPYWWRGGDRVAIYNGFVTVFEGKIIDIDYAIGGAADQGLTITAVGAWGSVLGQRNLIKNWSDIRISDGVWIVDTGANGAELATLDRQDRLRITPKAEAWANGNKYAVSYTMPTGQTIKRIAFDYDMQEAAQAWELAVVDRDTPATLFSTTASGTGSQNITLGTPVQTVYIEFISRAAQTPTADGTYYGEITNLFVYSETGAIDLEAIAGDVVTAVSDLNSSTAFIGTPSTSLELDGFITGNGGAEAVTNILNRAAAYGDGDNNAWYVAAIASDAVESPDGKPVLKTAQYPALTDYDYMVSVNDDNLNAPIRLIRSYEIANYIIVQYRDNEQNKNVIITPDDDSTLTDTDSVSAYGQRERIINAGTTSAAAAADYGRRVLASNATPRFSVSAPINVVGYIRDKNGAPIPASQIQAGKRIRIINFIDDLAGTSGAGLTFIITRTQYNDEAEVCSISTGTPDSLDVFLARG